MLEDISGVAINGYRAASYSITKQSEWAIEILVNAGFRYDSSIVPVRHDLYGMSGARPYPYRMGLHDGRSIVEFPPSTLQVVGQRIPIGGGGYFRIFPYWFSKWGMGRINERDEMPFSFYLHPWEIDQDQPRINAGLKSRFRHYNNLDKFEPRLRKLLQRFQFDTMSTVLDNMLLENVDMSAVAQGAH